MVAGVLNPKDIAHTTTTRPARVSGGVNQRRWFSNALGTELHDQDMNDILAQIRYAADFYSIPDVEGDDTILQKAINAGATALTGNLLHFQALVGGADKVPYFTGASAMALFTASLFSRNIMASSNSAQWRDALGISAAISDNVTAFGALASAADKLPYFTGPATMDMVNFAAWGRGLVSAADAAATRLLLGFGSGTPTAFFLSLLDDADAATARTTLGLATIASSASATDLTAGTLASARLPVSLSSIYGLTPATDRLPYYNGASSATLAVFTAFARTILDDPDAPTARATLGLATVASSASASDLTSGTLASGRLPASLSSIYGLTPATDRLPYFTGAATAALAAFTAFGRSLVAAADAAATGLLLGLAAIATSGSASDLVTGTVPSATLPAPIAAIYSLTPAADRMAYYTGATTAAMTILSVYGRTLIDDADAPTARATLGLVAVASSGSASDLSTGTLAAARLPASLSSIYTLTPAADQLPYYSGASTAVLTTLTTYGRSLIDDIDAATARTTLGLVIGTNVQAFDTELAAIAGLVSAADQVPYFTGSGTAALMNVTAAARTVLDDTTVAAMATTLGLGTASSVTFGNMTVSKSAAAAKAQIIGDAGQTAGLYLQTGATNRWAVFRGATAEAGSDAGSEFIIGGYNDAGTYLGNYLTITRATGNVILLVDLAVTEGGTGASTAAGARTNLGLAIGTDVLAYNVGLSAIAGLTPAADRLPYYTGTNTAALATFTAFARTLVDDVDAPTMRTTLGLAAVAASGSATDLSTGTLAAARLPTSLSTIYGLTPATDQLPYYNGAASAALTTLTATGRSLIAGASAAAMRTTLGLVIGTDVQAQDAELAAIAGLVSAADQVPYFTGSGTAALTTVTAAARTVLDDTTVAAMATTLGLGTASTPTFAGVTVSLAGNAPISISGNAGSTSTLYFQTAGSTRWAIQRGNGAETGSNAGSVLNINRFDDTGVFIDTPLTINRATGALTLSVDLAITEGGTGASTAAAARTNLGVAIGANVQAWSAKLDSEAALTWAADQIAYQASTSSLATTPLTAFARTLIDDANATAARATLGLIIGTNVQAWDTDLDAIAALTSAADQAPYATGAGTWAMMTVSAAARGMLAGATLSDIQGYLGIGTASTGVLSGLDITASAAPAVIRINADTGQVGQVAFRTGAAARWAITKTSEAEAGANAGSNLLITGYDDSGVAINNPISIARATGALTLAVDLAITEGGTGASTAAAARTNLGLAIGTDVQAFDAELTALAGLASAADRVPYFTGSGTAALATFTAFARTLVAGASAAAMQTTLGLVPGTDVQPYTAALAALSTQVAGVTTGLLVTTAANTVAVRTMAGTANRITITNPGGVAGNPTFDIGTDVVTLTGAQTLTNKVFDASANTLSNITTTMFAVNVVDNDNTLTANSATRLPTQQAVKTYVDTLITGSPWKSVVRAATTAAGTLATSFANGSVIDGVTLATGDRILIKNQTSAIENGIYVVAASGAPARAPDMNSNAEVPNATVFVAEGTTQHDTQWTSTNDQTVNLGVSSITFVQVSGTGTYTAGFGLTLTGSSFAITDAELVALAGLTSAVDQVPMFTGSGTASLMTVTAAARTVLDDTTVAAMATTLGLGTGNSPVFAGLDVAGVGNTTAFVSAPASGNNAQLTLRTGTSTRWQVSKDSTAESGANAGSNFRIVGFDDTGVQINIPILITRATGALTLAVDLAVTEGGTGASTAAAARTNLGVVIGTNVQAWSAKLDSEAALTWAADTISYQTSSSALATTPLTSFARTFLDDTTAAAVRTTIGAVNIAGDTMTGSLTQAVIGGAGLSAILRGESTTQLLMERYSADNVEVVTAWRKARGTFAVPADVNQNDFLGILEAQGYAGGAFRNAGYLYFTAMAATPSATDMQGKFVLSLSASGSITPTALITADWTNGIILGIDLAITQGGTGASTASGARTNLGVAIGADVQAWSAKLDTLAGQTWAADTISYQTSISGLSTTPLTSFARTLIDDTSAAAMQTTLGLVIGTDVQAQDAELSAIAGLTSAADQVPYFTGAGAAALMTVTATARTLLDDTTTAAMRTTLGLVIGTDVQAYSAALAALNTQVAGASTGLIVTTAANTVVLRTMAGTANRILITNPGGVAGNPTFDIGTDVVTLTTAQTLSNKVFDASANALTNITTSMFAANVIDNDTTLAANSATRLPTQQAIKAYVDNLLTGISWKQAVRAATTANGTLATAFANGSVVDGVTLATGDRILLKNQTTASQNGIYTVNASGAPTRAVDMDTSAEVPNATMSVLEGTTNAGTQWTNTNNSSVNLGVSNITFAQISGAGTYAAGFGLTLTGNSFAVSDPELVALAGLASAADQVPIFTGSGTAGLMTVTAAARTLLDDTSVANIATTLGLGTGNTPTFAGLVLTAALPIAQGGTAAITAAAARTNLGVVLGADVQAWSAKLDTLAAQTWAADTISYQTSTSALSTTPLTAFARTLIDDANAAAMQTTLGLVIGTNVQAYDVVLQALSGLTPATDKMAYYTSGTTAATTTITALARTLIGGATAAVMATTLGLGTGNTPVFTGLNVSASAATAFLRIDADAGQVAQVVFRTGTSPRWSINRNGAVESGANTGSNFTILGFDDTGVVINTPILITRATGAITLAVDLDVTEGGTGASTASGARTNLGVVIGTNVQAWAAKLDTLAGQTWAADTISYQTSASALSTTPLTSFARTLIDDANAAAMQTTLGLVIGTNVQAWDTDLDALAGLTYGADLVPYFTAAHAAATMTVTAAARTVLDDTTVAAMATTLGLGTGNTPTFAGLVLTAALPIAQGGTGATTAAAAATALGVGTGNSPTMAGLTLVGATNVSINLQAAASGNTANVFFRTGALARWAMVKGASAESGANAGSNFTISAYDDAGTFLFSPITIVRATGVITLSNDLDITEGGTGASSASGARTNLGLVIGTDVQAWAAKLDTLAGQTWAADTISYQTSASLLATTPLTAFARTFLDDTTAAAVRTTLGLVIGTNVQAWDADLDALAGLTSAADQVPYFTGAAAAALMTVTAAARTVLDDTTVAAMRTTLGVVIGSNVQAWDADLDALAGLTSAADQVPYFTGSAAAATMTVTSVARTVLDDTTTAAMLTTLGAVPLAGGVMTGALTQMITGGAAMQSFIRGEGTTSSLVDRFSADATSGTYIIRKARGSLAVPADVVLNDALGAYNVQGYSGGAMRVAGGISFLVIDVAPSATQLQTQFKINVNAAGTITSTPLVTGDWTNGLVLGVDLAIASGGTGASTAAAARINLGVDIGSDVQAYDAELAAIAGLVSAADRLPYFTGSGTAALATFTSTARTLLAGATAAAMATTLGLGTLSAVSFNSLALTTALPIGSGGTGSSSAAGAATNLGLGTGNTPTFTGLILSTPLPLGSGGTGATTAAAAATALGLGTGDAPSFSNGTTIAGAGNTSLNINGNASGNFAQLVLRTGAVTRWAFTKTSTAEGGANAGSDLTLTPFDDAGTTLGAAITITRATGNIVLGVDLAITEGGTGASTAGAARTNLGIGTGDTPTFAGLVLTAALPVAQGGTGSGVVATARTNLGLGTASSVAFGSLTLTTKLAIAQGGTGASTAAAAATALGVGTGDTPTFAGLVLTAALPVAQGGTGSTTAVNARSALGLVIGTNVQAWDADLDALAALGNGLFARTAANTWTARVITGTANQIDVTNGSAISGDPTLAVSSTLTLPGSLDIGTFSATGATSGVSITAAAIMKMSHTLAASVDLISFYNSNGLVGRINTSASATVYNTSSDGRLKTDLRAFDSGAIIDGLEVWDFEWRKSGDRSHGVIAQEAIKHWPQAVLQGGDDPTTNPWGIDYGQFTPLLLQEIKNLRARVAQLEARQ